MSHNPVLPTSSPASAIVHSAVIADLEPDLARMVDRAMAAVLSGDTKPDTVFGNCAGLVSMARSVSFHEGKLLEWGVIRIAACNSDLQVMPQDKPMPVVPAALEFLERNEWSKLEGIRLRSEVHSRKTYTPDIVLVNRKRHSALIVDMKRSLASYAEHRLEALRQRMMAVALVAADWLYVERKAPFVSEVSIAIIDGSDQASDHSKGVFGLSEIGDLLEIAGAGEAMMHLRAMFAARVREELGRQCRAVVANAEPLPGFSGGRTAEEHPFFGNEAEADLVGPDTIHFSESRISRTPEIDARVKVGFARTHASP